MGYRYAPGRFPSNRGSRACAGCGQGPSGNVRPAGAGRGARSGPRSGSRPAGSGRPRSPAKKSRRRMTTERAGGPRRRRNGEPASQDIRPGRERPLPQPRNGRSPTHASRSAGLPWKGEYAALRRAGRPRHAAVSGPAGRGLRIAVPKALPELRRGRRAHRVRERGGDRARQPPHRRLPPFRRRGSGRSGSRSSAPDPDAMAEAAALVTEAYAPDFVDINFGCPVKKVGQAKRGIGLPARPGSGGPDRSGRGRGDASSGDREDPLGDSTRRAGTRWRSGRICPGRGRPHGDAAPAYARRHVLRACPLGGDRGRGSRHWTSPSSETATCDRARTRGACWNGRDVPGS